MENEDEEEESDDENDGDNDDVILGDCDLGRIKEMSGVLWVKLRVIIMI